MLSFIGNIDAGILKVNNPSIGDKFAVYIIRDGVVREKIWYQSSRFFFIKNIYDLFDCQIRFYTLSKDNKKNIFNFNLSEIPKGKTSDYLEYFKNDYPKKSIEVFVNSFLTDKFFFNSLMSVKHGSNILAKTFLPDVCDEILNNFRMDDFITYTEDYRYSILTILVYISENKYVFNEVLGFLKNNENTSKSHHYLKGIIYYKLNQKTMAEDCFKNLILFKDDLEYHQAPAISYTLKYEPNKKNINTKNIVDINVLNKSENYKNGIVLMSCDYGYYKSYAIKTLKKCSDLKINCHLHVVFRYKEMLQDIDISWFKENNIGLSYEFEPAIGNKITYYSIARYIVLKDIMELYNTSVIVSDVDINFETSHTYLFDNILPNKIGLIFNNKQKLPWLQILAGFNFFGKDTKDSQFIGYLKNFLIDSYFQGKDPWMLDQVALKVTEEKTKEEGIVFNLKDEMTASFKQYDNRVVSRREAREAIAKFES